MPARPTIADVARAAGVSKGAASHALNGRPGVSDATRARVRDAATALGWFPNGIARALSGSRADALGWAIVRTPKSPTIDPYFTELFSGIELALAATPLSLVAKLVTEREEEDELYAHWAAERRVDGVLLSDVDAPDWRFDRLNELGLPFAAFHSRLNVQPGVSGEPAPSGGAHAPSVWLPELPTVSGLLDHVLEHGHRRIGWISGDPLKAAVLVRERATLLWAREHEASVVTVFTDYSPAAGANAAVELLRSDTPPTCLVFDSDIMALAGVSACHALGLRVPDDISIASFIDSPLCEVAMPPITALKHPIVEFGQQLTLRLLDLLGNHAHAGDSARAYARPALPMSEDTFDSNGDRVLPVPTLTVRQSVGPAANGVASTRRH
ncbi:LacI family DNA-binding transcriptional regulator [Gryllotalpicola reticulitermitis]|uniref:LacI family DNA-binding transcriptional regulator n=1 Tax=Gryllotalpicola reticulitermitis TaxID=1184153 RepID=A0ABV8Q974_9MICO